MVKLCKIKIKVLESYFCLVYVCILCVYLFTLFFFLSLVILLIFIRFFIIIIIIIIITMQRNSI